MLSFDDTRGSQGSDHYVAPNPEFGATFTYYLRDSMQTLKQVRQEAEKKSRRERSGSSVSGLGCCGGRAQRGRPCRDPHGSRL